MKYRYHWECPECGALKMTTASTCQICPDCKRQMRLSCKETAM